MNWRSISLCSQSHVQSSPHRRTLACTAAWRCICVGGISAATSRAITDEANANLGAITYYFGSKEKLIGESLAAAIRRLIEPALATLRQPGENPDEQMLEAVIELQKSLTDSPQAVSAYLEIIVQSVRIPLLGEQVKALFAELRILLSGDIERQQEQGHLPSWVEPEPMAALLLAVAQGVAVQTLVDPNGPSPTALSNQFAQLLISSQNQ